MLDLALHKAACTPHTPCRGLCSAFSKMACPSGVPGHLPSQAKSDNQTMQEGDKEGGEVHTDTDTERKRNVWGTDTKKSFGAPQKQKSFY